jgi:acyl-coenzyme A synthetase/AMP-(fatty) acid ligase
MDLIRELRFDEVLDDHRRRLGDRSAVVDGDMALTYRELAERVDAVTRRLHHRGFGAGDRLAWVGGSFRLPECFLATARLGGVFCPVSAQQPSEVLDAILDDCRPAVVIGGDSASYEAALTTHRDAPPVAEAVSPDAPLLLLYTMLGDRAVGMQVPRATLLQEAVEVALRGSRPSRVAGPLHHIGPLVSALAAIIAGTTVVVSATPAVLRTLLEL